MKPTVTIVLFGSLKQQPPPGNQDVREYPLRHETPLQTLIERYRIPADEVQLAMVNYRAVGKNTMVKPGDRVALFPREYPFFVDWNGYR